MKFFKIKPTMIATILMLMMNVSHADKGADIPKKAKNTEILKALTEQMSSSDLEQLNMLCKKTCKITVETQEQNNLVGLMVRVKKPDPKNGKPASILVLPSDTLGVLPSEGLSDLMKLLRKKTSEDEILEIVS